MSIALPSSLLSRFDLVLMLRDTVNQEWDALLADYILNGGYNYSKLTSSKLWSTDILQVCKYFLISMMEMRHLVKYEMFRERKNEEKISLNIVKFY